MGQNQTKNGKLGSFPTLVASAFIQGDLDCENWELGPPEDRYIEGGILSYPAGNLCGGVREWESSYSE